MILKHQTFKTHKIVLAGEHFTAVCIWFYILGCKQSFPVKMKIKRFHGKGKYFYFEEFYPENSSLGYLEVLFVTWNTSTTYF